MEMEILYIFFFVFIWKQNATPIPPKTAEQTKAILMQFPVSSGLHHRTNESEWVPVEPTKPAKKDKEVAILPATTEPSVAPKHKAQSVNQSINDVPLPTNGGLINKTS